MKRACLTFIVGLLLWGSRANAQQASAISTQGYKSYAVAADDVRASQAGAEILKKGGNAADAAVATMLALGVVSPASSGMGGGGFALYYRASDKSFHFIDFREQAPEAASADMFKDKAKGKGPASAASQIGGLSSGVPGEPAGAAYLHGKFGSGKVSLSQIVDPAARYAERGITLTPYVSRMTDVFGGQMKGDRVFKGWFPTKESTTIPTDRVIKQPALAKTLRAFGRSGKNAIYSGRIAKEIVRANKAAGGIFTLQDLKNYRVIEREPLSGDHFGFTFVTAPPPSAGGYTMLASLATLEATPARYRNPNDRESFYHALAESWKGPFWDRERYFGDPDHVELPLGKIRAKHRHQLRARRFHPFLARSQAAYALPVEPENKEVAQGPTHGTSHFCVVDQEGNVASITSTINLPFGARYTAAGMVMNDQMDDFARGVGVSNAFGLVGGARNLPGPRKRPVSTMTPTIVTQKGKPVLCVGAAGGSKIVTATQQVALNHLLAGQSLDEAMKGPRIHHQGKPATLVSEESSPISASEKAALQARGHVLSERHHLAVSQAISMKDGVITAASDPRKGGAPAGL